MLFPNIHSIPLIKKGELYKRVLFSYFGLAAPSCRKVNSNDTFYVVFFFLRLLFSLEKNEIRPKIYWRIFGECPEFKGERSTKFKSPCFHFNALQYCVQITEVFLGYITQSIILSASSSYFYYRCFSRTLSTH